MFKFITEAAAPNFNAIKDVELIENKELGTKDMYIMGIFIQCLVKNRNGRIYDKQVMEQSVQKYVQERMSNGPKFRSYGELGHPEGVEINLHRVSHMITELTWQGNDVYGKAKLLDTEYGRTASTIIRSNGQLGVSSRGLGELSKGPGGENIVTQFELIAEDIVADPSAPEGYVEGILEGKEYIIQGGLYTPVNTIKFEKAYNGLEKTMSSMPKKDVDAYILNAVKNFFKEI